MLLNFVRKKLFITGKPGVGKTTLILKLVSYLKSTFPEKEIVGFYTEELRERGKRTGFVLKTLPGYKEYLLAKKTRNTSRPRVGSYEVFCEKIEAALNEVETVSNKLRNAIFVVDEVGKMEVLSQRFCEFFNGLINSKNFLIATVGESNHPYLSKVRNLKDAILVRLDEENRDFVFEKLKLDFSRPGKLIVFEGIDGSGKTTLSRALKEVFERKGVACVLSEEPTNSKFGQKIRAFLRGELQLSKLEVLNLFLKDRKEHTKSLIIPAIKKGEWVILDRYYLSTAAYQSAQGFELKRLLVDSETTSLLPDLVVFLDVPPEEAIRRLHTRGLEKSVFEKKEFLRKVYENYKRILPLFKHVIVPVDSSPEKALEELQEVLFKLSVKR